MNVFDGAASVQVYGPVNRVDNGAWHHVVVVFDRDSGITVWVGGVSKTTAAVFTGSVNNVGDFVVGKSPGYA